MSSICEGDICPNPLAPKALMASEPSLNLSSNAVSVDCASGDRQILASHVLLALGRTPNTDDLALEAAGIKTDARGFVVVDDWLRTSAAGVRALGDCNGRGAFTHTSYGDADMVAANVLDGETRSLRNRVSAYALYTDPPRPHEPN